MRVNRFQLMTVFTLLVTMLLVVTSAVAPVYAQRPDTSPPRPGGDSGSGGGGGDSGGGSGPTGEIRGIVTDLTTGQPAGGIEVSINGGIVRTDSEGKYSITGLAAGNYTVQLSLSGQASPVQGAQIVQLPGGGLAIVDLQFTTGAAPAATPAPAVQPTATPQVAIPDAPVAESPPELPDAGGDLPNGGYYMNGNYAFFNLDNRSVTVTEGAVSPIIAAPVLPVPLCSSIYTVQQNDFLAGQLGADTGRVIEATNLLRVEDKSVQSTISPGTIKPGFQLCVPIS
jgi:hypothetical protein